MATTFVYSGAAGLNNGTSWTDAWTSLASSNGAAAGDTVKVHYLHSETSLAANINWSNGTVGNPVQIISVDKDNSDALRAGASVEWTTTNLGPQGNVTSYGMTWKNSGAQLNFTIPTDGYQQHESGTMVNTGANGVRFTASSRGVVRLMKETIDLSGTSGTAATVSVVPTGGMAFEWVEGTYTTRASQTSLFGLSTTFSTLRIVGVDMSANTVTNLILGSTTNCGLFDIIRCKAPTFTNVFGTTPVGKLWNVNLNGFQTGTLTVAVLPPNLSTTLNGTVSSSTSRYRTGGANDGSQANAYSWECISNASAKNIVAAMELPPISRWVGAGSQTITLYVASGVTLNNDELWFDVRSPSEAVSATSQAALQSSRCNYLATPAALTTDGTSTWNGTGVGTKQKVSFTIAPTIPGIVSVRGFLAKASTTVYIDPVIDVAGDVTGYSRMVENIQTFASTAGGSSSVKLPANFTGGMQRS